MQWTAPDVAEAVDRRVVASPGQVRVLLDAVRVSHAGASTWWPSSGAGTTRAYDRPRSWPCERVTASCRHPGGDHCNLPGQNPGPGKNGPTTAKSRTPRAQTTSLQHRQDRADPRQDVAVLLKIYANCIDGQEGEINDRITAALTAHHDHETLPPAPAVDTAAQTKPRTRARTVGSGPRKTAGQPS